MATAFLPVWRPIALSAALLLTSAGAAEAPPREAGRPFAQLFQRSDYRGHPQVWCGAVDARGLLYFGNYAQVVVYDGVRWERIAVPGAKFVRALVLDAQGRMWVGAAGAVGYIDTVAPGPSRFVSLAEKLPADAREPDDIQRVHVLGDRVFFQSQTRLLRWQAGTFTAWPLVGRGPWNSLVLDGTLLVQNPMNGWSQVGANGLEPATAAPNFPAPTRFALPMSDERWLFGTLRVGLFTYDGKAVERITSNAVAYLSTHFLFNGLRLADGRFLLTTRTGGAVVLDRDLGFQWLIDDTSGLPGNSVNHAVADAHGGIWLCLDDGIVRIADAFSWFPPPGPLARIDRFALARFDGRLHLGLARDLLRLTPPTGVGTPQWVVREKFDQHVTALLPAGDALLMATADGVYASRAAGPKHQVVALEDCMALVASTARPGTVFVAHREGITALRVGADGWKADPLLVRSPQAITGMVEDGEGTLWTVSANGQAGRIAFAAGNGEPAVEFFAAGDSALHLALAGRRPLFLGEGGLRRFDPGAKKLVPEPALGARFADGTTAVRAAIEDRDGGLWIAPQHAADTGTWSETTVGRVTRTGEWQPLAIPDPTRIGDINGLHLERDGDREILWIVGVSAILRVDLAALGPTRSAGATLVREAVAVDQGSSLLTASAGGESPRLAYAQNSVRFRVGAPGLAGQPGVTFESELRGLSHVSRQTGISAEREFTNLWEGRYVFRARARGPDGRWTIPVELAFTVLPPWWRTGWAFSAWTALAVGSIFGSVRLGTRALRQRAARLEATVAERTMELHARNEELSRLHRLELDGKISAQLAEEKAQLEVLRYQLNPHFLFNALNSICTQIMQQPAAARAMVVRLADFCRHTLHRPRAAEHATIGEEFEHLRAYLDIEKVRLGELLEVEIAVAPGTEAVRIPPFLLLPLVENAVKYGAATSPDRVGVRLGVRRDPDGSIVIEIANSGTWVTPGTAGVHSTRIGLDNLRQRLARYFPDAHAFTTELRDGWVIVRLRLSPMADVPALPK